MLPLALIPNGQLIYTDYISPECAWKWEIDFFAYQELSKKKETNLIQIEGTHPEMHKHILHVHSIEIPLIHRGVLYFYRYLRSI